MPHILAAALEVRAVAAVAESMSCGNGATSKIEADMCVSEQKKTKNQKNKKQEQ